MDDRERTEQQTMDASRVQLPDVERDEVGAFVIGQIVRGGELRRPLEVRGPAIGTAVDVADQLLKSVQAHCRIRMMRFAQGASLLACQVANIIPSFARRLERQERLIGGY